MSNGDLLESLGRSLHIKEVVLSTFGYAVDDPSIPAERNHLVGVIAPSEGLKVIRPGIDQALTVPSSPVGVSEKRKPFDQLLAGETTRQVAGFGRGRRGEEPKEDQKSQGHSPELYSGVAPMH